MPSYCRWIKLNDATYLKRRQYPTPEGERYFDEARFITATFDASPKLLNDVERLLRADEGVLRFYTTRTRNNVSKIRGESFRNRYLNVLPMAPPSWAWWNRESGGCLPWKCTVQEKLNNDFSGLKSSLQLCQITLINVLCFNNHVSTHNDCTVNC